MAALLLEAGVVLGVIAVGGAIASRLDQSVIPAYILAGATAVQMGTMLFAHPRAPLNVARGLTRWARKQGVSRLTDLVGRVETP